MKFRMFAGWLLLGLLWLNCTEPQVDNREKGNLDKRHSSAAASGIQAIWKQAGFEIPSLSSYVGNTSVQASGQVDVSEETKKGNAPHAATQRLMTRGEYERTVLGYNSYVATKASPLGVRRLGQLANPPCPKKEGNNWVLEGVRVEVGSKEATGTLIIRPDGIAIRYKVDGGSEQTRELELDKNSPLKVPNYAALFEEVLNSQVKRLTDAQTKAAEGQNVYSIANSRILSLVTLQAKSEQKQNKVLKETERSSELIFSKNSEYHTARYFKELNDGALSGVHETLTVLLGVTDTNGEDIRIFYHRQAKSLDCGTRDGGGGTTEPVSDAGSPDTAAPDAKVDCSQYQYKKDGATYPSWFGGPEKGSICAPIYDKLFVRNGQKDLKCKTNADCYNPCGVLCCRSIFLELVACVKGTCQLTHTTKCAGCETQPQVCQLPPGYKP